MVGVAGRSRACGNCRKRHIRCDETRPTCKRCTIAKLECGGYRDLTVIQYNGSSKVQKIPASSLQASAKDALISQILNFGNASPWQSIAPKPDDVFVSYTLAHLLKGNESMDPTANLVDRKLADQCFLALATSYFGHDHYEKRIVERGLQRYGVALNELHSALADAKRCTSYDILESVILMSFFEVLLSNNKDGWIAHALGMQRIFELRGPETFQKMPERAAFQISRPNIIFASLVLRQPTILSQSQWKTVPWELDPDEKILIHHLVDILADCPGILVSKDQAMSLDGHYVLQDLARAVAEEVNDCLRHLQAWKNLWDTTEPDCCGEIIAYGDVPTCVDSGGASTPAWYSVHVYKSLYHANALTLYHATHIFLLRKAHDLVVYSPTENIPDLAQQEFAAAIEICRSIDYHLQKLREGGGSFFFLFTLRMAWEALGTTQPAIGLWLHDVLKKLETGAAGRWALAGYLLDINNSTSPS